MNLVGFVLEGNEMTISKLKALQAMPDEAGKKRLRMGICGS
jgi:hypothetical protein